MSRRLDRPVAACTLAVSLTALWAGALPCTAHADDSLEEPLASVAALTDAASSVTADALAAADASQLATTTEPLVPTEPATPVEEVEAADETAGAAPLPQTAPSDEPADDAEPPEAPASAAMPDTTAPTEAPGADTTPDTGDTTADTPAPAPDPAVPAQAPQPEVVTPPPAPSTSVAPASTNVNVSVRINSPGDNGAVTQLNVTATVPQPTSPEPAPAPTSHGSTAQPAPEAAGSGPAGGVASDEWYWSWNCLDAVPFSPISPTGSGSGSVPISWTWIWNCGDNNEQYRGETLPGFQQQNTNISIRFASPGDDGPVSQVNVAVSLPVAAGARVTQAAPASSSANATSSAISLVPIGPELGDAPGLPAVISASNDTDIALPASAEAAPVAIAPVTGVVASPGTTRFAAPLDLAHGVPFAAGLRARGARGASTGPRAGNGTTGRHPAQPTVPGGASAAPAAVSADVSARHAARPATARAAPSSRKPGAEDVPLRGPLHPTPLSGASAAAAGSGGSPGSGLPFLLALPFVAAMLDLARRVAFERATWPSGHRRRVPDRPG